MGAIRLSRVLPAPRAAVWAALTDPDALADWLMPNDFAPRVGHRFTFRTDPAPGFDGIVRCEVLELVERERLRFSWVGGPLDTTVTFTLADDPGGTRLVLEHEGFEGLRTLVPRIVLGFGWRRLLAKRLASRVSAAPAFDGGAR